MSGQDLVSGAVLADYRLVREIGRGAMGIVFEATGPVGQRIALKVLAPPPLLPPEERGRLRSRFLREARALQAVDHPNVVRIHASGESEGRLYLAMELLDGENLRSLVAREGALPPERAVAMGVQLCAALGAVHAAGIVHRDVKPENALLLKDGSLKLTDFGIAWMEDERTLTRTGGVLGSPAYMAPERILGEATDRRSDVFSVAATLYQLLSGRLPFPGESLVEMAHNVAYAEPRPLDCVPRRLADMVLRGLSKSPAARFATTAEMAEALRRALAPGGGPAWAPEAPVSPTPSACCARHPRRVAIGCCEACGRALCRLCARSGRAPHYCRPHAPVTVLGISTVRLEVALALAAFALLLLCLSPLGYAALWR